MHSFSPRPGYCQRKMIELAKAFPPLFFYNFQHREFYPCILPPCIPSTLAVKESIEGCQLHKPPGCTTPDFSSPVHGMTGEIAKLKGLKRIIPSGWWGGRMSYASKANTPALFRSMDMLLKSFADFGFCCSTLTFKNPLTVPLPVGDQGEKRMGCLEGTNNHTRYIEHLIFH